MTGAPVHVLTAEEVKDVKLAIRRLTRLWKRPNLSPERTACRARLIGVLRVLDHYPDGCELRPTDPGRPP